MQYTCMKFSKIFLIKKACGDGEMFKQLQILAALPQVPSSFLAPKWAITYDRRATSGRIKASSIPYFWHMSDCVGIIVNLCQYGKVNTMGDR